MRKLDSQRIKQIMNISQEYYPWKKILIHQSSVERLLKKDEYNSIYTTNGSTYLVTNEHINRKNGTYEIFTKGKSIFI
jgi:hypothetical protein